MITIDRIDHLVLTVRSIAETCEFYNRVLGMTAETFGDNRKALKFGNQKINLHEAGAEFEPRAERPTPGSGDLCLISIQRIDQIIEHMRIKNVLVEEGPVSRTGATGPITSIYFRDPDGNLVEVSSYG